MDVLKAMRDYITRMVSELPGVKALLLDDQTTTMVSMIYSQTEIIQKEVYLVDKISKKGREKLPHVKAICFLRPSPDSIQDLIEELTHPKYSEYYIYFSNIVRIVHIERIAQADTESLVKEVQEFFGDYYAVNHDLFTLNLDRCIGDNLKNWYSGSFERATEGLTSVLLSLKKRPLIRYESSSELTRRLATELNHIIQHENSLFDFRVPDTPPILLILDRRNDPITPLLSQWTYQAMLHELIGINNNIVSRANAADKEEKEIVLTDQDVFYKKNMFLNFGDLGANIKNYVDEFQKKSTSTRNIESIADMKRFVEEYPEFRKLSGYVSKHVALVSDLSKIVDKNSLMDVSEVEQELAVNEDHGAAIRNVNELLSNPKVDLEDKARVVLLYALRYERFQNNETSSFVDRLQREGADTTQLSLIASILKYSGASQRQGDLFQNENLFARSTAVLKKGLKGVENIYTQHVPLLDKILEEMIKGKLNDKMYPFVEQSTRDKPHDVIVFIVGGATYEEARFISQRNATNPNIRIVLGGTTIHNSKSFLSEVEETMKRIK